MKTKNATLMKDIINNTNGRTACFLSIFIISHIFYLSIKRFNFFKIFFDYFSLKLEGIGTHDIMMHKMIK